MLVNTCYCGVYFSPGGGIQLWVTRHVPPERPYFFSLAFTERLHFFQLSPNDPLFFENFDIFDEMLRNFWPFWPWKPLIFDAFHGKTPYFWALCHWKTPFFDAICHRKTPTSEVLGGTRTSLLYVSAPPPDFSLLYGVHFNLLYGATSVDLEIFE